MGWNKGRLCWKIAKLFYFLISGFHFYSVYFCHLKKLVRPETFGPYYVHTLDKGDDTDSGYACSVSRRDSPWLIRPKRSHSIPICNKIWSRNPGGVGGGREWRRTEWLSLVRKVTWTLTNFFRGLSCPRLTFLSSSFSSLSYDRFISEFSRESNLLLRLSVPSVFRSPKGHPVTGYVIFLVFESLLLLIL